MEEIVFKEWPKIHRLNRNIIVTEKIDGTNACVIIHEDGRLACQSRSRIITPANDNHGFANWAYQHADELRTLGKGYHYGEWWGNGIQRGYGLPSGDKRFSLFNITRWKDNPELPKCCSVVPVLYCGPFDEMEIKTQLMVLRQRGSFAAPFMNPEGIVVYHTAANISFKVTLEGDEKPKGTKE